MNEFLTAVLILEFFILMICFGIGFYLNIWILCTEEPKKHTFLSIINPLSNKGYRIIFSSLSIFKWKIDGEKLKLKKTVNKSRNVLKVVILTIVFTIILILISS